MQALFSVEIGGATPADAIANLAADLDESETRRFLNMLVFETLEHRQELDRIIVSLLHDWTIDRLPTIDRVVLRMALYELRYRPETPPAVVLDEAIGLVKRFSTEESGAFVNGLLAKAIER